MIVAEQGIVLGLTPLKNSSVIVDIYFEKSGYWKGIAYRILRPVNLFYSPVSPLSVIEALAYLPGKDRSTGKIRELTVQPPYLTLRNELSYFICVEASLWNALLRNMPPDSVFFNHCIKWLEKMMWIGTSPREWSLFTLQFIDFFLGYNGIRADISQMTIPQINLLFKKELNVDIDLMKYFKAFNLPDE